MPSNSENGWNEWAKHVLRELERAADANEDLRSGLEALKIEIAKELASKNEVSELKKEFIQKTQEFSVKIATLQADLTAKAGLWGAVAGAIPAVVAVVLIVAAHLMKLL